MKNNDGELAACVRRVTKQYFREVDGRPSCGVYDLVLESVERPLIEVVLAEADGNQTRASELLGINRNTLKKKLVQYKIDH